MIITIRNQEEWEANPYVSKVSKLMSPKRFPCFLNPLDIEGKGGCKDRVIYQIAYLPANIEKITSVEAFETSSSYSCNG